MAEVPVGNSIRTTEWLRIATVAHRFDVIVGPPTTFQVLPTRTVGVVIGGEVTQFPLRQATLLATLAGVQNCSRNTVHGLRARSLVTSSTFLGTYQISSTEED